MNLQVLLEKNEEIAKQNKKYQVFFLLDVHLVKWKIVVAGSIKCDKIMYHEGYPVESVNRIANEV